MDEESCRSAYDSASSRAHAPQAGAALKSTSSGLCCALAWLRAASMSLVQVTAIRVLLVVMTGNWMRGPRAAMDLNRLSNPCTSKPENRSVHSSSRGYLLMTQADAVSPEQYLSG